MSTPAERPRLPRSVWLYTTSALWCVGVVSWHVTHVLAGDPLSSVWWALPLNVVTILLDGWLIRGHLRRAAAAAEQEARTH